MVNVIHHITSCCGAGKSYHTINQLYVDMAQGNISERTVLVASKSKLLLEQNENFFNDASRSHPLLPDISTERIDDSTAHKVVPELSKALREKYQGVLFITHKALSMIDTELLAGVRVIIDEVPNELVKHHSLVHSINNNPPQWSTWLRSQGNPFQASEHIQEIDPPSLLARPALKEFVEDVREAGKKGTHAEPSGAFVGFLLSGHGKAYTNTSPDKTKRYYNAICDKQLVGLLNHASHITILSAQLKETVLGFILEHCLKITINETSSVGGRVLSKKHKKRIKLIPFLKKGSWSRGVKEDKASNVLMLSGTHVNSQLTCGELVQEFAGTQIPHGEFLLTRNKGEVVVPSIESRASISTNQVHGMNSFIHLHHAAYVATSIPAPYVVEAYNRYIRDKGVFHLSIDSTMKTEYCHEAAYQCIARTSLRDASNSTPLHIIVVPDREYADYVASWFDQGYVIPYDQDSYVRHNKGSKWKPADQWLDILCRLLTDYESGNGSITSLCKREKISRKTYYNKRDEFREELIKRGYNLESDKEMA